MPNGDGNGYRFMNIIGSVVTAVALIIAGILSYGELRSNLTDVEDDIEVIERKLEIKTTQIDELRIRESAITVSVETIKESLDEMKVDIRLILEKIDEVH